MKEVAMFDQKKVRGLLDSLDFFEEFTVEEKNKFLALRHHFVAYEAGELLIEEGTCDAAFFVLLWGSVNVTTGGSPGRTLAKLDPGEFFGEISFLTSRPRTTNVVATGKVLAMKIDQPLLKEVGVETREKIKDKIIRKLVQRLDSMNKALAAIP